MQDTFTSKQWLALIGISLLTFTCFLDITIVSNALPAIRKSLGATDTELQWLVNTIYIALCALMATIGRLGDVFGLRKVFYISMAIMALASFACGIATSIEQLIIFRAIQGVSFASITIAGALVTHNFSLTQQPKAMSIFSAISGLGLALGPVIGGILVDLLNWRWIFFINVPIVIIGILICSLSVTEKNEHETKQSVDWLGALFFVIAITSLVTTLIEGEAWGWRSAAVIIGFGLALVSLVSFIFVEKKVKMPLMPFPLLTNSIFITASLTCFTCGAFISILLFYDPLYLQTILGYSPTYSGWILFSASLAYVIMSPIAGVITDYFNAKVGTWIVCLLLVIAAYFHSLFNIQGHLPIIILGLIAFGMAWGTVNIPPVVAVMQTVKSTQAGVMLGSLWTIFNLGCALMLALIGLLFRYLEKYYLLQNLNPYQPAPNEAELLQQLISAPEQSAKILSQFPAQIASQIMPAYQNAFMHSFNVMAWVLFANAALAFVIVLCFMKRFKNGDVTVKRELTEARHSLL